MSQGLLARRSARVSLVLVAGLASILGIAALTPAGISGVLGTLLDVYTNPKLLESSVRYMGPIAASAVGLALAYRARFITIGSEGQVILGAAATLWLLAYSGVAPSGAPGVILALALGGLVGALWGVIPGVLRAYAGVNEVLSSLMLNYVALSLVNYAVAGPWRSGPFTMTEPVPDEYSIEPAVIVATVAVLGAIYEFILRRTGFGVAVESYGIAPRAAYTYAIPPGRLIVAISLIAGLAAGIGGSLMMLGFQRSFRAMSQPPGYGYMGILVAWLALRSPALSVPAALFFSTLITAGYLLQTSGVPFNVVLLLQALIVLVVTLYAAVTRRR